MFDTPVQRRRVRITLAVAFLLLAVSIGAGHLWSRHGYTLVFPFNNMLTGTSATLRFPATDVGLEDRFPNTTLHVRFVGAGTPSWEYYKSFPMRLDISASISMAVVPTLGADTPEHASAAIPSIALDDDAACELLVANRALLTDQFDVTLGRAMPNTVRGNHTRDLRHLIESGRVRGDRWELVGPGITYTLASLLHPRWVAIAGALAGVAGIVIFSRVGRPVAGCCMHCGYDLRATPHGSPCPECGNTPSADGGQAVGA